jgi:hypothetical protein
MGSDLLCKLHLYNTFIVSNYTSFIRFCTIKKMIITKKLILKTYNLYIYSETFSILDNTELVNFPYKATTR